MSDKKPVILASASPRRHEILTKAGIEHTIITAEADEHSVLFRSGNPEEFVRKIAHLKNSAVRNAVAGQMNTGIIISADTIVYHPQTDRVLGKPKNKDDAFSMISALSGSWHEVITGVVVYDIETGREEIFHETTKVFFRDLSPDEIMRYVESGDPLDKAGAYGMQNGACIFVEKIEGDYFNVIGLPICHLAVVLKSFSN